MNETKVDRTCATCACAIIRENPQNKEQKQMFCMLNPPGYQIAKMQVPRVMNGNPVMSSKKGEEGKPILDTVDVPVYVYPPTQAELTCFRGWRPIGAQPGQKNITEDIGIIMGAMEPILNALGIFKDTKPLDG